jgi:hypothetical protein
LDSALFCGGEPDIGGKWIGRWHIYELAMSKTYSLDEIASDQIMQALFATISYRLEPDGWATRFPAVLEHLQQGSLGASRADQALMELGQIEAELRSLPPDRVVWSLDNLHVRNDSRQPVNHNAKSIYDYFVAQDGTPVVNKLREIALACRSQGNIVKVESRSLRKSRRKDRLTFAGSLVGGIAMTVYNWYQLSSEHTFFPMFALSGPVLVVGGLAGLFMPRVNRRWDTVIYVTVLVVGLALGGLNAYLMEHYFK